MNDSDDIARKVAELEKLLAAKFSVRGAGLETRLRKAGRRLPRQTRQDIAFIAKTSKVAGHPKLAMQMDFGALNAAFLRARDHLKSVDVADRRKGAVLGALGGLAFNLILAAVLLVLVLIWRGFV